jgi:branched-subunit amino acid aminotransferase/4-amino-4-deoxychorismate lyase
LPANEPLAQFKTCNKLPQIMARAEADAAGADEALLLNTDGHIVEGSSSNLFWIQDGTICTPPLASGILPGVTRAVVFEVGQNLGLPMRETSITPEQLKTTNAVFISLSTMGIVAGQTLDQHALRQDELVSRLHSAYWDLLQAESTL